MSVVTKRFPVRLPNCVQVMDRPVEESLKQLRDTNWRGVYEIGYYVGSEEHRASAEDLVPRPIDLDDLPLQNVSLQGAVPKRVGTVVNYGISQIHGQKHIFIEVEIPEEHVHHFDGSMTPTLHSSPVLGSNPTKDENWRYFIRFDRHSLRHHFDKRYGDLHCLDPEMIEEHP
jgi:hypothetical protein